MLPFNAVRTEFAVFLFAQAARAPHGVIRLDLTEGNSIRHIRAVVLTQWRMRKHAGHSMRSKSA
jgi:hypothetical protein